MKTFHNLKFKTYLYEKLDTSMGVFRNRELSQGAPEKITTILGKVEAANYKRITIRMGGEEIQN